MAAVAEPVDVAEALGVEHLVVGTIQPTRAGLSSQRAAGAVRLAWRCGATRMTTRVPACSTSRTDSPRKWSRRYRSSCRLPTARGYTPATRTIPTHTTAICADGVCCSTTPRRRCPRRSSSSSRRSPGSRLRARPRRGRNGECLVQRSICPTGRGGSSGPGARTRRRDGRWRRTVHWRKRISRSPARRARPTAGSTGKSCSIGAPTALALDPSLELAHLARMRAFYHLGLFDDGGARRARGSEIESGPQRGVRSTRRRYTAVRRTIWRGGRTGGSAADNEPTRRPCVNTSVSAAITLAMRRAGGQCSGRSCAEIVRISARRHPWPRLRPGAEGQGGAQTVSPRSFAAPILDHHVAYSVGRGFCPARRPTQASSGWNERRTQAFPATHGSSGIVFSTPSGRTRVFPGCSRGFARLTRTPAGCGASRS